MLEVLRARGLLVRVRDAEGEPGWELVHDSLVPRVLAWIDRRDLDRRRAIELRPLPPPPLARRVAEPARPRRAPRASPRITSAIAELDAEWKRRDLGDSAWTPARLVDRSRQVLRRRAATFSTLLVAALAVTSLAMYRSHTEQQRAALEASLRARDLGRFTLALEPFDWDPVALRAVSVDARTLPVLRWTLHAPREDDPIEVGDERTGALLRRGTPRFEGRARVEHVEAPGGPAFLVVTRGACDRSIVPIERLPGYTLRDAIPPVLRVRVPTCQASAADMIELAAAPFLYGGVGEPPSQDVLADPTAVREQRLVLPAFAMDRTEVTNAAFDVFAEMAAFTGISRPTYPVSRELANAGDPAMPVSGIEWGEARAYCRFVGKQLASVEQWTRALRGPERLADGSPNPMPRRNLPWGDRRTPSPAKLAGVGTLGPARVASFPLDRSPEGILDLAGNVSEWTRSVREADPSVRIIRGGNWAESTLDDVLEFIAIENPRVGGQRNFALGARCTR